MRVALLPILTATLLAAPGLAQIPGSMGQVVNPSNGHTYHILEESTWTDAQAAAIGLGGHLVTIDDQAENDWVFQTFGNWAGQPRDLWIGFNDIVTEGTFEWVSGDPIPYTNWAAGQPDNYIWNDPVNGEDHVHMYGFGSQYGPGEWNDMHDADPGTAGWTFGLYGVVEVEGPIYTITNLVAGSVANLRLENATPSGDVLIGVSLAGPGPTQTIYGQVEMSLPITQLPVVQADAAGVAQLDVRIKPFMQGRTIYTQAIDLSAGQLSNALVETVL